MPISITKNRLDDQTIKQMISAGFSGRRAVQIEELKEGYFNAAYRVVLDDGLRTVLKIAPPMDAEIMTHEKNIMFSEVNAMRLVEMKTRVPIAHILLYDNSRQLCESDYFLMRELPGKSFFMADKELSDEQKTSVLEQMGRYTAEMNAVEGERFGYYGQPNKQGAHWYTVFRSMIEDVYQDAERKKVSIAVEKSQMLKLLEANQSLFHGVTRPRLVHWDLWAGNVFVAKEKVTGLIDFERCLWADELMEVGFRTYDCQRAFLDGYGIDKLDKDQVKRAKWYDVYLFLIWSIEGAYRQYEDDGLYQHGSKQLVKWIDRMTSESAL